MLVMDELRADKLALHAHDADAVEMP